MVIDGHTLAEQLLDRCRKAVQQLPRAPRLVLVACDPVGVTRRYLTRKQEAAAVVGVEVQLVEVSAKSSTQEVIAQISAVAAECDGLVVQLPLPDTLDTEAICAAIPAAVDVDALRPDALVSGGFRSPVAAAVAYILKESSVSLVDATAVVVGAGRLVGQPVTAFLQAAGAQVQVVTEHTDRPEEVFRQADIIVLGAGVPALLQPEMVKPGVAIIDAATSEQSGRISGDADPACAEEASVFTPVPGGVGPITVAALLQNVVRSAKG